MRDKYKAPSTNGESPDRVFERIIQSGPIKERIPTSEFDGEKLRKIIELTLAREQQEHLLNKRYGSRQLLETFSQTGFKLTGKIVRSLTGYYKDPQTGLITANKIQDPRKFLQEHRRNSIVANRYLYLVENPGVNLRLPTPVTLLNLANSATTSEKQEVAFANLCSLCGKPFALVSAFFLTNNRNEVERILNSETLKIMLSDETDEISRPPPEAVKSVCESTHIIDMRRNAKQNGQLPLLLLDRELFEFLYKQAELISNKFFKKPRLNPLKTQKLPLKLINGKFAFILPSVYAAINERLLIAGLSSEEIHQRWIKNPTLELAAQKSIYPYIITFYPKTGVVAQPPDSVFSQ